MRKRDIVVTCGVCLILLSSSSGCTYTVGHFNPNTQYAYPNSNIKSLGPVKAEVSKTMWILTPQLKLEDVKQCYNDALSKASGANILINYSEDTTFTTYPIIAIHNVKYVIEGEAARMTIGRQDLR